MACHRLLLCAVVAFSAVGCGQSSLTSHDAGRDTAVDRHPGTDGGRDGAHDANRDGSHDGGRDGSHDAIADAAGDATHDAGRDATADVPPLKGRQTFDVAIKLVGAPLPGSNPSQPFPTNATATLVVDATERWLLIGGEGQGTTAPVNGDGAGLAIGQPVTLAVPFASCDGKADLRFATLTVTLGSDGKLHGIGTGQASYIQGDIGFSETFSATLDGVPDTTAPGLPIRTAGVLDPLAPARFAASEPLPVGTRAQLVAADGGAVELTPEIPQSVSPAFVTAFRVPTVLPFGGSYRLALNQVVDFAGNQASLQTSPLVTLAAPDLLDDGSFESTPVGMWGAGQVFAAGDLPVITGTKSLYVDTVSPWSGGWSLTFRLPVHPGDKAVRFAYRITSMYGGPGSFFGGVVIGSPGSKIATLSGLPAATPTTSVTRASGTTLTLGPVATAELALPDASATEVAVKIFTPSSGCGLRPPANGLILDDLRTAP